MNWEVILGANIRRDAPLTQFALIVGVGLTLLAFAWTTQRPPQPDASRQHGVEDITRKPIMVKAPPATQGMESSWVRFFHDYGLVRGSDGCSVARNTLANFARQYRTLDFPKPDTPITVVFDPPDIDRDSKAGDDLKPDLQQALARTLVEVDPDCKGADQP
jgi:hypothetical protein